MSEDWAREEMRGQVAELGTALEGRRIIKADMDARSAWGSQALIYLDDGTVVELAGISDCCAYGEVENFLLHADKVDNVITRVTTNDDVTEWYVLADMDEVMRLSVGWSEGNGYYSFGLSINVKQVAA